MKDFPAESEGFFASHYLQALSRKEIVRTRLTLLFESVRAVQEIYVTCPVVPIKKAIISRL